MRLESGAAGVFEFRVGRSNPLFKMADRRNVSFFGLWLVALAVLLGGKAVIAAAYGTLMARTSPADFAADAAREPLLGVLRDALGFVGKLFPAGASQDSWTYLADAVGRGYAIASPGAQVVNLPYIRDYVDIAVMLLMAVNVALVRKHWRLMDALPSRLWANGAIDRVRTNEHELQQVLTKCDEWVNRPAWDWVCVALAAVVSISLNLELLRGGMYPRLFDGASTHEPWQQAVAAGWWANPAHGLLAFSYQLVVVGFIAYLVFRHNVVGVAMVRLGRQLLRDRGAATDAPFLRIQPDHPDGCCGLRPLRDVLAHVYLSILVMAMSLFCLAFYLPTWGWATWMPLFMLFVVVNPAYVLLPLKYVHQDLNESKASLCADLERRMARLKADVGDPSTWTHVLVLTRQEPAAPRGRLVRRGVPTTAAYLALRDELAAARTAPTFVFSSPQILISVVTYIIPLALFAAELARL